MIRILLLDCSSALTERLKAQGFDVESGTVGFSTGTRYLPSQIYEHNVLIYNPPSVLKQNDTYIDEHLIADCSPEFSLKPLRDHILNGATLLIFVNRVASEQKSQNAAYGWIPFMPSLSFTRDKVIESNSFQTSPAYDHKYLAPVLNVAELETPVRQKIGELEVRGISGYCFGLFWNAHLETLGEFIRLGGGHLIILPRFKSNAEMIETFLHRVVPKIYDLETRISLVDKYVSPAEHKAHDEIERIEAIIARSTELSSRAKTDLASARREKAIIIKEDAIAKQILNYYDTALKQEDVALFYLYKIVELIENKYGGEAVAIKSLGFATDWKSVKRTANVSYGDIRHAPKPSDVIVKWSNADIKKCFEATEKITFAYFATLFPSPTVMRQDKA